ncbi:MAG TPA: homoserine kinase [Campylobacterales bacterium]|nr:homoserine kinase [Campylobacterales bacterium]
MTIKVPATSANLGPGFDSLGLAIELNNIITIKHADFISVSIKGEGSNKPGIKTNNQFVNIFYNFYIKLVGRRDNFRFEFNNFIPFSRGLGSSSAVIVSAIAAAYEMAEVSLSKEAILDKALFYETHPDNIAPAVHGGFTASMAVKNEHVYTQKKEIPSYLKAVMVIPNKSMSTAKSRAKMARNVAMQKAIFNLTHTAVLTAAFFNEDWSVLRLASEDKMHQNLRMNGMRELYHVQKTALLNGALMSTLSGSGSSFFNLAYQDDAPLIQERLKAEFPRFRVEVYDFNNSGYLIEK